MTSWTRWTAVLAVPLAATVGCGGAITDATSDDGGIGVVPSDAFAALDSLEDENAGLGDARDDEIVVPVADASVDADASDAPYTKHPWDASSVVCPPGSHLACDSTDVCNAWDCVCDDGRDVHNQRECFLGSCVPGIEQCVEKCGSLDDIWWFAMTELGDDGEERCVSCDAPGCGLVGAPCGRDDDCCSCACGFDGCE